MLSKVVCLFKYPISPQEGSSGTFLLLSWSTNLIPVDRTCMYNINICTYLYTVNTEIPRSWRKGTTLQLQHPTEFRISFSCSAPPVIHCSWSSNTCCCESALDPFFVHICWWDMKGTDLDLPKAEWARSNFDDLIHNLEHVEIYRYGTQVWVKLAL